MRGVCGPRRHPCLCVELTEAHTSELRVTKPTPTLTSSRAHTPRVDEDQVIATLLERLLERADPSLGLKLRKYRQAAIGDVKFFLGMERCPVRCLPPPHTHTYIVIRRTFTSPAESPRHH